MVDILLASYNGQSYIKNQILSLQQQTYSDWRLIVRDDGSNDNTLEIINEFRENDSRIHLVEYLPKYKVGACANFLQLLHFSFADYVMFCDQDDIWFEKKIEILVNYAKNHFSITNPQLAYCDAYGYSDREGVITHSSVSSVRARNLREFLFMNSGYQGSCMLFNQKLASLARDYRAKYYYMHDDVVALLAHVFGQVHYVPKKLMLYRQHDQNVTGNIQTIYQRANKLLLRESFVLSKAHFDEKKAFFESYQDEISETDKKLFHAYFQYPELPLLERIKLVIQNKFGYGGSIMYLLLKTLLQKPMQ